MKRYGNFFSNVCSFEALNQAVLSAARGKKTCHAVACFLMDIESETLTLEKELLDRNYRPRPYTVFMVHDPKDRMICAADFRDRVVQHALCAQLGPILDRPLIHDTYACREGKGTHCAILRAQHFARRFPYFLKLDVHKFFASVDHAILKSLLRRMVKDSNALWLMDLFIDHAAPGSAFGKGLPIGNLTSQHFANFYLSGLDHFVKEGLRIEGYVRYMDDMVLFADEKATLWDAAERIRDYLRENLKLQLKPEAFLLASISQGLPFLGFRVFRNVIRLDRRGWRRFRRKMAHRDALLETGIIDENDWQRTVASLLGHIRHADTHNLRANYFKARGSRGSNRVIRGGSWNNPAENCRSAYRNNDHPDNRNGNLGFRLSSSQQRPDAARLRTRRQRQSTDHRPGPAPAAMAGQTKNARRRTVGHQARTPSPGTPHVCWDSAGGP